LVRLRAGHQLPAIPIRPMSELVRTVYRRGKAKGISSRFICATCLSPEKANLLEIDVHFIRSAYT
jgi:hypothetical protein